MTTARHRRPHRTAPALVRPDRSGRLALTFLAVVGMAGPTWTLREQGTPLLHNAGSRPAIAAPDASAPGPVSGH